MLMSNIRVLYLGDIVGRPGRRAIINELPKLMQEFKPDLVLANGENLASGSGLTLSAYEAVIGAGVDYLTTGNHVFKRAEFVPQLDDPSIKVLRPINYSKQAPGRGKTEIAVGKVKLNLVNLSGTVFMGTDGVTPAFEVIDNLIKDLDWLTIIDFHAEATSEKAALAHYLDGKVAAVLGTHTHVPTADLHTLPGGTLFISDLGMTGPQDSALGVEADIVVRRFQTGMSEPFEVAKGPSWLNAIVFTIDPENKKIVDYKQIIRRDLEN